MVSRDNGERRRGEGGVRAQLWTLKCGVGRGVQADALQENNLS